MDSSQLVAALACGVVCAALGWFVPALIARIPEPEPEERPEAETDAVVQPPRRLFSRQLPPAPEKTLYADIAARHGLAWRTAVSAGTVAALLGAKIGLVPALALVLFLVPLGVALFIVDLRVHLLPAWVIHRGYLAMVALVVLLGVIDHDLHRLYGAGWGWLVFGGWFYLMWLIGGFGFGDVRLARLLGPALGYLGWPVLTGAIACVMVLSFVGGIVVAVMRRSVRARIPYGPYLLVGSVLGVLLGPTIVTWYLGRTGL